MSKIFRKIRQSLLKPNDVGSYLIYAIGEIALVMIGILLALQVNNWNENRKTKKQLQSILNTVSTDLKTDTIRANSILQFYDTIKKKSDLILQKKMNRNNYKECPTCLSLVSIYQPFVIQKKGYELLENFSDNNEVKNDTLVNRITQFYNSFNLLINDSNVFIKDEVLKNIETFKTKDWFVDWSLGTITEEMIIFFTESEEYRKMVAANDILAGRNHRLFVQSYKDQATVLLERLEKRFND
jgi:hypothetical protein